MLAIWFWPLAWCLRHFENLFERYPFQLTKRQFQLGLRGFPELHLAELSTHSLRCCRLHHTRDQPLLCPFVQSRWMRILPSPEPAVAQMIHQLHNSAGVHTRTTSILHSGIRQPGWRMCHVCCCLHITSTEAWEKCVVYSSEWPDPLTSGPLLVIDRVWFPQNRWFSFPFWDGGKPAVNPSSSIMSGNLATDFQ